MTRSRSKCPDKALHGRFDLDMNTRLNYGLGPRPPDPDGPPPEREPSIAAA